MKRTGLEQKFFEACEGVVHECGYLLYDFEYLNSQKLLRVFIMDEASSSAVIDDCVKVDRALSPVFEENDWIPEDITLEVSSPGIYRKLKTRQHYDWSVGKRIQVKFRGNPVSFTGDKKVEKYLKGRVVIGVLENIGTEENFEIKLNTQQAGQEVNVVLLQEQVVRAQWEPVIRSF